jgi:hypothetical protein
VANFIFWYHAGYSFGGITENTLFMVSRRILFPYMHNHAQQELSWLTCTHTLKELLWLTCTHKLEELLCLTCTHKLEELLWLTCTHKLEELSWLTAPLTGNNITWPNRFSLHSLLPVVVAVVGRGMVMSSLSCNPLSDGNTGLASSNHPHQCGNELDDPSTMGVQSHCLLLQQANLSMSPDKLFRCHVSHEVACSTASERALLTCTRFGW